MKNKYFLLVSHILFLCFPLVVCAGPLDSTKPIIDTLTNILNFLLSIAGILSIIGLGVAGFLYLSSAGDLRRVAIAKKAFVSAGIGLLLSLGGYILFKLIAMLLRT